MRFPSREEVERIREKYPPGTRVKLIRMEDDPWPVPAGTEGVVDHVDDAGGVHTIWSNGSGLVFIPDHDYVVKIE